MERFAGIDVSKKHLEVAVRWQGGTKAFRVTNTPGGIRSLVKQLGPLVPVSVVMEASGGYERNARVALGEGDAEQAVPRRDVEDAQRLLRVAAHQIAEQFRRHHHHRRHRPSERHPDRVVVRDRPFLGNRRPAAAHGRRQVLKARADLRRQQEVHRAAAHAIELLRRGHAERMFLSQDFDIPIANGLDWYPPEMVEQMQASGAAPDWSMTMLFEHVIPTLKEQGMTDEQLDTMMVQNPKRWLGV